MTKMIKMSLIAAVAVTGMTSVATAQPLEDAIKGVDFSGNVRYRYTDNQKVNEENTNEYRLELTTKAKVNDMVTATVATGLKASTKDSTGDADPSGADVKEANFAFALPGATVIAGKQALATPFASGQLEDQQGTGVVALVPAGPVTIAAGYYLNSDASTKAYSKYKSVNENAASMDLGANNISAVAVLGKVSGVDFAAWYAKVSESALGTNNDFTKGTTTGAAAILAATKASATAMNLNAKAAVGPVNVEVNYAKVDYSLSNNAANLDELSPSQSRIVLSGKVSDITLAAGMVMAGKDGGDVTLGDDDASANFGAMETFTGVILKDTTAYYLAAFAPVGPVTVGLEHGMTSEADGSAANSDSASETKLSVAYKMSKNFTVSAYATQTSGALDNLEQNRVELKYTF